MTTDGIEDTTATELSASEQEALECAIEYMESFLDTKISFERRRIERQIATLKALVERQSKSTKELTR